MEIQLTGPSENLPRCSVCGRPVDGVAVFEIASVKRITRCYNAFCHGSQASLIKCDGIERRAVALERHRRRMERWDPFPVN